MKHQANVVERVQHRRVLIEEEAPVDIEGRELEKGLEIRICHLRVQVHVQFPECGKPPTQITVRLLLLPLGPRQIADSLDLLMLLLLLLL